MLSVVATYQISMVERVVAFDSEWVLETGEEELVIAIFVGIILGLGKVRTTDMPLDRSDT